MLAHADHHLERARIQEVADQHARGVAEQRVGGLAAAPQIGFVDDVVVQQRRRVDELDDRRQLVPCPVVSPSAPAHEQQQRGPQPLAAGADDVLGDLVDQHHFGCQALPDDAIDLLHVLGDRARAALAALGEGVAVDDMIGKSGSAANYKANRARLCRAQAPTVARADSTAPPYGCDRTPALVA